MTPRSIHFRVSERHHLAEDPVRFFDDDPATAEPAAIAITRHHLTANRCAGHSLTSLLLDASVYRVLRASMNVEVEPSGYFSPVVVQTARLRLSKQIGRALKIAVQEGVGGLREHICGEIVRG